MKKTIKVAVIGALLAAGISRASAQSNVWDQPMTFTLATVVQNGPGIAQPFAFNTKTLISLMSSQTITNFGEGTVTNTTITNVTIVPSSTVAEIDVTNDGTFALSTNSYWFT